MKKPKTYLQCGYEYDCKTRNCLNCPRKEKITIEVTHAEFTVADDFSVGDLTAYEKEKPQEFHV